MVKSVKAENVDLRYIEVTFLSSLSDQLLSEARFILSNGLLSTSINDNFLYDWSFAVMFLAISTLI